MHLLKIHLLLSFFLFAFCHVPVTKSETVNLAYVHYSDPQARSAAENSRAADFLMRGRTEEALILLVDIINADRSEGKVTDPEVYLNLSGIYFLAKDHEKVERLWRSAVRPGHLTDQQIMNAAHTLDFRGRTYEYAVVLEESLRALRMPDIAARELAYLSERTGNISEAFRFWMHYLLLSKSPAEGYLGTARLFYQEKKYSEAYYFMNLYNHAVRSSKSCLLTLDSWTKASAYDRSLSAVSPSFYPRREEELSGIRYRAFRSLALRTVPGADAERYIYNLLLKFYKENQAVAVMKRHAAGKEGEVSTSGTIRQVKSISGLAVLDQCDPESENTEIALMKGRLMLADNPDADLSPLRKNRTDEEWKSMLTEWYGSWKITSQLRRAVRSEFEYFY